MGTTLTPIPKSILILELLPKLWSFNLILRNWLLRSEISQGDSTCKDFPQRGNACISIKANKKGRMKMKRGFFPGWRNKSENPLAFWTRFWLLYFIKTIKPTCYLFYGFDIVFWIFVKKFSIKSNISMYSNW